MRLMATIAVLAGCSVSAVAGTVIPVSEVRSLKFVDIDTYETTKIEALGPGPISISYGTPTREAYVYQNSSITTYVVTADMLASSFSRTSSDLAYRFTVITTVPYSMAATLFATETYDAFGLFSIRLKSLDTEQYMFTFTSYLGPFDVSYSGTLAPGNYELGASVLAGAGSQSGGNTATNQFEFTLPEPTMVLLLLPGMGLLRRRCLST